MDGWISVDVVNEEVEVGASDVLDDFPNVVDVSVVILLVDDCSALDVSVGVIDVVEVTSDVMDVSDVRDVVTIDRVEEEAVEVMEEVDVTIGEVDVAVDVVGVAAITRKSIHV